MAATLLIGILTGVVSALLVASASTGSALGVLVLFFLAPMPVAIAALGWNSRAALVAVGTAALLVAIISGGRITSALFYVAALGGPAALLAHLLMLARTIPAAPLPGGAAPAPALEWYPVGRVVMAAALWAGILAAVAMELVHADLDTVMPLLRRAIGQVAEQGLTLPGSKQKGAPPTPQQIEDMARLMLIVMPAVIATFWFFVAVTNQWLAAASVALAGRLKRPWPDLATMSLPAWLALVLAAALALSFFDGPVGRIAGCIAAGCFAAYTLTGLAVLHFLSRGLALRPLLLLAAYLALVIIPPIAMVGISLLALAEPVLSWSRAGSKPQGPPPPPT